jgi:hypothetical protein
MPGSRHAGNPSGLDDGSENMSDIRELTANELNDVSGGEITVVADKDYVGIEVRVGGYGFGVWATGGQLCGAIYTPHHNGGTCIP